MLISCELFYIWQVEMLNYNTFPTSVQIVFNMLK